MKKFFFSLDTVLRYKEQILDNLKGEHARILQKIRMCEQEIEALEQERMDCAREFGRKRERGMAINDIRTYENYLESLRLKIIQKKNLLERLLEEEEKKREQVVEAKKETASIEKLRERKLMEYDKQVQKEEERFIEEFVVTKNALAKVSG